MLGACVRRADAGGADLSSGSACTMRSPSGCPRRLSALAVTFAASAAALLVQTEAGGCAGGNAVCSCFLRGGVSPTLAQCDPGTAYDTWLLSRKTGNWTAHQGANCYADHGATWATGDLSVTNKTTYTLATCEAACQSNTQCNAVTVGGPPPPPPPAPCPGGIGFNPGEQIPGPASPDNVSAWRKAMNEWQSCVRSEMNYSSAHTAYDVPELKWTRRCTHTIGCFSTQRRTITQFNGGSTTSMRDTEALIRY
eukprot:COSAG02_NODE_5553_length_4235_cov_2.251451_2_plen_252_part_00